MPRHLIASSARARSTALEILRPPKAPPPPGGHRRYSPIMSRLHLAPDISLRALSFLYPHPPKNVYSKKRCYATTTKDADSPRDPTLETALGLIESGTRLMEEQADLQGARSKYKRSVEIRPTSGGWFNLGVSPFVLLENELKTEGG